MTIYHYKLFNSFSKLSYGSFCVCIPENVEYLSLLIAQILFFYLLPHDSTLSKGVAAIPTRLSIDQNSNWKICQKQCQWSVLSTLKGLTQEC